MKVTGINLNSAALLGLLIVGGVVVLYVAKKGVAGAAAGVVTAVGDAAAGTVVGIGQTFGIPATSETACEKAKREGRTWDASFACPASNFLGYIFGAEPDATDYYDETERLLRRPRQ
jgi:hypothetical protein